MIDRSHITGVVLAGGRGTRLGGADKGLQTLRGVALARRALDRLRPQVGRLLVNANRHVEEYATFGVPVCVDTVPGQPGPLAGLLAGLAAAGTPWLAAVPCDGPHFPDDLVRRLAHAVQAQHAEIAIAVTLEGGTRRRHPVYCLLSAALRQRLADALDRGERRVQQWVGAQRCVEVLFDDPRAFLNANTPAELKRLELEPDHGT
jgi:molybdopterin-guanine dinucleotide biosynthesis protein A